MKYIIFLFIFCMSAHSTEMDMISDVTPLKWENRIILVNTTDNKDHILKVLKQHDIEINERDIVWFVIQNDTLITNFNGDIADEFISNIGSKYNLLPQEVILIGKDGRIKYRHKNMELATIFLQVDAMPMRQVEMQRQ